MLEAVSLGGYVALFRTVFSCQGVRIGWRASYQITMAGVVASKLFAAAGAGGVALTVWALRASGLSARSVARRVLAFEFLLYGVYAGALIIVGAGLRSGLLVGQAPWTVTVAPAILGASAIALLVSIRALPRGFERRLKRDGRGRQRFARAPHGAAVAGAPWAVREGLSTAFSLVAERKPWLIGAIAYWGFDIATLWACFHAFGSPPPAAVIVMAYFLGALANVLPAARRDRRCRGGHGRRVRRLRHPREPGLPRGARLPPDLVLVADDPGHGCVSAVASNGRRLEG